MPKRAVTIKEVAERAGLSVTTVSLVFNGKADNIPYATRQKVEQAATELNYQPNYTARSLVTGKTHTIGVIIPDISNNFFSGMVRHLQTELNKHGYDIILCNSEEQMSNDLRYIRWLAGRKVDGLVLILSAESMEEENREKITSLLEETEVPHIFVDRYYHGDAPRVSVDNEWSGRQVAEMLLAAGHKNIGVITGPMCLNSSINRLKGVTSVLSEHGIELPKENIVYGKYNMISGKEGAAVLIKRNVSVIFAFNDMQAYGVISYLKENGVKIPEDVSVVGFDDDLFSTIVEPKLTTVKQPIMQLSHEICDMILAVVDGKEHERHVKLATQLILRDSVRKLI